MKPLFAPRTRLRLAWFCFGAHILGVAAMALALRHGLPPTPLESRRAFIAAHPAAWGAGWATWMVAALSLLLFLLAWADTLEPKGWGVAAAGVALAGAILDWTNEVTAIFLVPGWARQAALDPFFAQLYELWEQSFLVLTSGLANLLYGLGGLVLTLVAWRAAHFPRWLAWWGLSAWLLTIALSAVAFAGQTTVLAPIVPLVFGLFIPFSLVVGYRWLAGPGY
ncbi:MAG: hypothetical protein L0332_30745 [Chloroflexi bacterium]|nr:hypothetical protein [Chloroflexota bacterium]MCI0579805.1 hypothetical protein [Chloroflexota bacterium]MCI0644579.1 hypothetical protein [Chloroflexota bacterium]MCI0731078.1 hypothetical protein [Chloroflexota bacterium]